MTLVRLVTTGPLDSPVVVAAMDGWVDSGSAATMAASLLAEDGDTLATFDGDRIYDYRARRPTLEIVDGTPSGAHVAGAEAGPAASRRPGRAGADRAGARLPLAATG